MTGRVRQQNFISTLVQSAPRLRELIGNMTPTWHLPSLAALDPAFIARHDIAGVIWDVDGTLTEHHGPLATNAVDAFHALLALPNLKHVLLSNADERRTDELAALFPEIPVIRGYRSGDTVVYRRLHHHIETWSNPDGAPVEGALVLRKPNADLVHESVRALGCDSRFVVMVGDQYLTDIAGANLAGIRSIKVPTLARASFPLAVQLAQRIEWMVYRLRYGQPGSDRRLSTESSA